MNLKRAVILNAVLVGTLALAAAIPREHDLKPAAVVMVLPTEIEGWTSEGMQPSEDETVHLAEDTLFEKRRYWRSGGEELAHESISSLREIHASIVLSGQDLNSSIHRPERCLVAQGFTDLQPAPVEIEVGDGERITVTRVTSRRVLRSRDGGESFDVPHLTYYWFVGHDTITADHYQRTFTDMKGRLLGGYNQRWAYFSISTNVTSGVPDPAARDEEATIAELESLVREIYQRCVRHGQLSGAQ